MEESIAIRAYSMFDFIIPYIKFVMNDPYTLYLSSFVFTNSSSLNFIISVSMPSLLSSQFHLMDSVLERHILSSGTLSRECWLFLQDYSYLNYEQMTPL